VSSRSSIARGSVKGGDHKGVSGLLADSSAVMRSRGHHQTGACLGVCFSADLTVAAERLSLVPRIVT
jgi:hypothetical protein